MSKPYLIIITSSTCGACQRYKQDNEKAVMEMLRKENLVTVIQINDGQSVQPIQINPELNRYIKWVPSFMLVTKESWEGKGPLQGAIMNQKIGYYSNDKFIQTEQIKAEFFHTSEAILSWIKRELSTNSVFNKNIPQIPKIESVFPYKIVPLEKTKKHEQKIGNTIVRYTNGSSSDSE